MTNEKVTLPREVADAIEEMRGKGTSNFGVLRRAYGAISIEPDLTLKKWAFDGEGDGTPDELMRALVNGYEVEKSPEDRVREYYKACEPITHTNYTNVGRRDGIVTTLDLLGITIEGVNA